MYLNKRLLILSVTILAVFVLVSCKTKVENKEYTLEYNSKTYEGKYTGTMDNNIPSGEGKFVFGNEGDNNYFIYDGGWENGEMKGEGTLVTNNYTVHFPKNDDQEAVDRTGQYNGVVVDGIANGKGTFSSTNDEGIDYTYKGQWKDGLYNGNGKVVYDSDKMVNLEGNFENGDFKPTPGEFIKMLGTNKATCAYKVSDEVLDYISNNEDVFLGHEIDSSSDLIKSDFSLEKFKKDSVVTDPYFIELNNLMVVNVSQSSGSESFGYDFTETLCQDSSIEPYRLYYFGHSDKLVENAYFNAIVLPLGYSTYDTVDGGKAWALVGWIVKLQ